MPFADVLVSAVYVQGVWWPIKATPAVPFASISIVSIFAARLLGAATRDVEVRSTNSTIEGGMSLKDLSIVSNNFAALPLATKNELPTSLP